MKVQPFENAILSKQLTPIQLFLAKGGHVKWFVCQDKRSSNKSGLVIYDSDGKAYTATQTQEQDILDVKKSPCRVVFNCSLATRQPALDIHFEDVHSPSGPSCPSCPNSPQAPER